MNITKVPPIVLQNAALTNFGPLEFNQISHLILEIFV